MQRDALFPSAKRVLEFLKEADMIETGEKGGRRFTFRIRGINFLKMRDRQDGPKDQNADKGRLGANCLQLAGVADPFDYCSACGTKYVLHSPFKDARL